ncbi:unnamed protein product [Rhizoctonia solani]|uniref:Uncharacterized protein n=1 Tax=Rhizoctonia solani TaxID=456999 RepID=A0A8H3CUH7_9AGAM|nr:unnamed protein product [Rhizoctonia solani]
MSIPPHPRWGHTIDSAPSYSLESLVDVAVDKELAGLLAMEMISRLATEAPTSDEAGLERDINTSTLESALLLALDPATIRHLANPPVISGCIQLLKSAAKQRKKGESPFSYEYGSLCFSIILFCFDICLLERFNMLDETLATRERTADVPVYVDTSLKLASILEDQFTILNRRADCDWIFGWSSSPSHHLYPPILPRSDISDLMNVIWDDRWYILTVSRMSSLLFLLSRYVFHERVSRHNPDGEALQLKLYELALRSLFAASPSHRAISMHIVNTNEVSYKWTNTPKQIDAQDSRLIMSEYIKQLSDNSDPSFLLGNIPAMMLRLVAPVASAETQDLLPDAIRCTMIYAWTLLTVLEIRNEVVTFAKFLFDHLHTFMQPPPGSPYRLIPSVRKEIMDIFHGGELLDWVARAIIRLDPNDPDSAARASPF